MKLTLKNVKINQSLSDETLCFSADVYVDGKKAFAASNRGCGGCNEYYSYDHALLDAADAYAKAQPPRTFADTSVIEASYVHTYPVDLDVLIDDLIADFEVEAQVKKVLRKIAFIEGGKLYTLTKAAPTPENIAAFKKRRPDVQVLNDLPKADAAARIKEAMQ